MYDRGGMRTKRRSHTKTDKTMFYERQCKCVVLVQTENLKHSLLTTLSPLQLHWCRKKKLRIFTIERFQAKQEQEGKLKEL